MTNEEVLKLIADWQNKDPVATQLLMKLVYAKIKELSQQQVAHTPDDANTAFICQSPTDIAHDSIIKLSQVDTNLPFETQREFFRYLNAVVRSTFIDSYRKQVKCSCRNPDKTVLNSSTAIEPVDASLNKMNMNSDLFVLLGELEKEYPRQAEVIQLRYLAQRKNKDISRLLNVSVRTVENDIRFAKAWLKNKY